MIVQSVGVSSRLNGKLASLPRHQNTNSPTPAPTESIATIGRADNRDCIDIAIDVLETMSQIMIRNIDAAVIEALRRRAAACGTSTFHTARSFSLSHLPRLLNSRSITIVGP